jgi:GT2 family glycosyltransferase
MPTGVLIVNYRAYPALTACLSSLQPHLRPGDEVVVVDYESDRDALAAALHGRRQVSALARADNLGFAAGVNLAAAGTRAPFLLVLNPDTIVEDALVGRLEDWMASHPGAGVVGPRVLEVDGSVQRSARRFPGVSTLLGGRSTWLSRRFPDNWFSRRNLVRADAAIDVDWVSGACLMTRRDVFESLGGFDASFFMYWEDADYCRRVTRAGYRCVYVPDVTVRHVGGASAKHDPERMIRAFHESAVRLYWKHAGRAGRLLTPLVRAGLGVRARVRLAGIRRHSSR